METPPNQPRSLTAWLASAAADRHEPVPERADEELAALDGDAPQCAASVVSGQRCRRPAAPGGELCAGHAAMGDGTVVPLRAAR